MDKHQNAREICPQCVKKMFIIVIFVVFFALYAFSDSWHDTVNSAIFIMGSSYPELLEEYIQSFSYPVLCICCALLIFQAICFPVSAILLIYVNESFFGLWGILFSYIGLLVGSLINFFIARIITQGASTFFDSAILRNIESYMQQKQFNLILVSRLLPFALFDVFSFIWGVSSCSFISYCVATAIGLIPHVVFYSFVLNGGGFFWSWFVGVFLFVASIMLFLRTDILFLFKKRV